MRTPRRPVHGVLLLDKPLGWTSQDALSKARGLLRALKAGHTGTLDPLATGLLPLCFGAATKFSQVSLDADKRYTATLKLGERSSTLDAGIGIFDLLREPGDRGRSELVDFDNVRDELHLCALIERIGEADDSHRHAGDADDPPGARCFDI